MVVRRRGRIAHKPTALRAIAAFEATKGLIALAAGFGLLGLLPHPLRALAHEIAGHLHLNPAKRAPRVFLQLAENLADTRLWLLALLALTYAVVRFFEAYGLWRERRWAEWLAALSGGIYIPFEVYELWLGVTAIKAGALLVNVAVVAYMVHRLR